MTDYEFRENEDLDLPEAPKIKIYKETFGDFKDITEEWHKNNRE